MENKRKIFVLMVSAAIFLLKKRQKERLLKLRRKGYKNKYLDYLKFRAQVACEDSKCCKDDISLTQDQFNEIVEMRMSSGDQTLLKKLTLPEETYLALLYLTKGISIRTLSRLFGLSPTSVSGVIFQFVSFINENLHTIKLPNTSDEWLKIMRRFRGKKLIPCLGALDGKHIEVKKPANSGSVFFNYKKYSSIVLMGLVDSNRKFLYASVGHPGSVNDATIFNGSELKKLIDQTSPKSFIVPGTRKVMKPFIMADGAFALNKFTMKPFSTTNLTPHQAIFNEKFSGTRVLVEQAFGILASRFQILKTTIELPKDKVAALTMALVRLHNWITPEDNNESNVYPTNFDDDFKDAKEQRDFLMECLAQGRI